MPESCCTSNEVTGGTYYRTYTNSGSGPTGEADSATISGFRLDKYDVTVARFRNFVAAWNGGWRPAAGAGKHTHLNGGLGLANSGASGAYETGWVTTDNSNIAPTDTNLTCDPVTSTWTSQAGSQENLPINCVNWYEAYGFCIWDGGFLPSEAEWEYAAAGGSQQREYPWGSTSPGDLFNGVQCPGTGCDYAIYGCAYPSGGGPMTCSGTVTVANIAPVGTTLSGLGAFDQLDLAGNVVQWTLDWYATYVDPCTDCAYLISTSGRTSRGGGYDSPEGALVPWFRGGATSPGVRYRDQGFRCARTP
jgi:formylglycine-generating enzyme required for sulfatase activity